MNVGAALPILTILSLVLTVAFFVLVRRRKARDSEEDPPRDEDR